MVGRMAAADPAMVREVARRGHTVGAHTWSHARLQGIELDKAKDEIELGFSAVSRAMQGPDRAVLPLPLSAASNACALDYLKGAPRRELRHRRRLARLQDPRRARREGDRAGAARDAPQGHPAVPRHPALDRAVDRDILDALKEGGYKVVHLVPKAPVATLAEYDAQADGEIAHALAEAKEPLAPRSVVWAQSDSAKPTPGSPPPRSAAVDGRRRGGKPNRSRTCGGNRNA